VHIGKVQAWDPGDDSSHLGHQGHENQKKPPLQDERGDIAANKLSLSSGYLPDLFRGRIQGRHRVACHEEKHSDDQDSVNGTRSSDGIARDLRVVWRRIRVHV
jgi:hypothetical protein